MIAKKVGYTIFGNVEAVASPTNPVIIAPNSDNIVEKPTPAPTVKDDVITGTSPLVILGLIGLLYFAAKG